jgi:amino acid adenylation domain-containing protein
MPDKIALIVRDHRFTYAELDDLSSRLAAGFRERGVEQGDRVVIFLDNCAEAVIALYAALKAGAIFSIVSASTKSEKLADILSDLRAKALVTHARLLPVASAAIARSRSVEVTVVAHMTGEPSVRGGVALSDILSVAPPGKLDQGGVDSDLAMISYTSGSTGQLKGVVITHEIIRATAGSIADCLENDKNDVVLSVLPISSNYGLYQILVSVMTGGTLILEKGLGFPAAILQRLRNERVTGFPLVPTVAAILLQMNGLEPGALADLRYITSASAAMPEAHVERLLDLFPTTRLFLMYGLTECVRGLYMPPEDLEGRPGSVGKAMPGTEAYIVDENGQRTGRNVVGELVIRGAQVMKGYWEKPEETAERLRPGEGPGEIVLHTGDLFRTDDEGYFYFVSRMDDVIKSRGEKVPPKEVEDAIYELPGVKEVTVMGVPDPILGTAIKAVIVPIEEGALSEKEVISHCVRRLEDVMVPKHVAFRRELPNGQAEKVCPGQIQAQEINAYSETAQSNGRF